jgi:hypothetical protein
LTRPWEAGCLRAVKQVCFSMDAWIMKSCGECGCGRACHGCSKTTFQGSTSISEPAKTHHTLLASWWRWGALVEQGSSIPPCPKVWQTVGAGQSGTSWYLSFSKIVVTVKRPSIGSPGTVVSRIKAPTKSHSQHHQCDAFFHVACLVRLRRSICLVGKLLIPHTFSWSFCIPDTA